MLRLLGSVSSTTQNVWGWPELESSMPMCSGGGEEGDGVRELQRRGVFSFVHVQCGGLGARERSVRSGTSSGVCGVGAGAGLGMLTWHWRGRRDIAAAMQTARDDMMMALAKASGSGRPDGRAYVLLAVVETLTKKYSGATVPNPRKYDTIAHSDGLRAASVFCSVMRNGMWAWRLPTYNDTRDRQLPLR